MYVLIILRREEGNVWDCYLCYHIEIIICKKVLNMVCKKIKNIVYYDQGRTGDEGNLFVNEVNFTLKSVRFTSFNKEKIIVR